jgi:hypothetical protein
VVGLLFLSSPVSSPCVGVWGLVGLLFEICIVDASIFTARLVTRWCGECVMIFAPWLVSLRAAVCEESAGSFLDCGVGRVFFGLSCSL